MSALTLTRQGTGAAATLLYAPQPGAPFAFLLWTAPPAPATPPVSVGVEETAGSAPAYAGWYVFGPGPQTWDTGLETMLRGALSEPELTSFAWFDPQAQTPVVGRIDTVAGDANPAEPVVGSGVVLGGLLEIGAGTPVALTTPDTRAGFGFAYPPLPGVPAARGPASVVWLLGDVVGTFRFTGLYPILPGAENVCDVSIDPLAVTDPARTFVRFTGQSVALRKVGDRYQLYPA